MIIPTKKFVTTTAAAALLSITLSACGGGGGGGPVTGGGPMQPVTGGSPFQGPPPLGATCENGVCTAEYRGHTLRADFYETADGSYSRYAGTPFFGFDEPYPEAGTARYEGVATLRRTTGRNQTVDEAGTATLNADFGASTISGRVEGANGSPVRLTLNDASLRTDDPVADFEASSIRPSPSGLSPVTCQAGVTCDWGYWFGEFGHEETVGALFDAYYNGEPVLSGALVGAQTESTIVPEPMEMPEMHTVVSLAGVPADHGIEPVEEIRIEPGSTERHGNVEVTCPAGGPACVLNVGQDGAVGYWTTGGIPSLTPAVDSVVGVPADHGIEPVEEIRIEPGSTERHGNVEVTCPAGGLACVLNVGQDGAVGYWTTGGIPSLTPAVDSVVGVPADHGIEPVEGIRIEPGSTERHGNVEVTCPAGGLACVLNVGQDGAVGYWTTGGVPSLTPAVESVVGVPADHGIEPVEEIRIEPGSTERRGNVEVSCPAGGPTCVLNVGVRTVRSIMRQRAVRPPSCWRGPDWPDWPLVPELARALVGGLAIENYSSDEIRANLDAVRDRTTPYPDGDVFTRGNMSWWHGKNVEFSPVMRTVGSIPLFQARTSDDLERLSAPAGFIGYGGWMDYSYFIMGLSTDKSNSFFYDPSMPWDTTADGYAYANYGL